MKREVTEFIVRQGTPPKEAGTLSYFDGRGRAEQIRLLLAKARVSFNDARVKMSDWPKLKPTFPKGTLPCWTDKDIQINETSEILKFLGEKHGFYPSFDAGKASDCDMTCDLIFSVWDKFGLPTALAKKDQQTQDEWKQAVRDLS